MIPVPYANKALGSFNTRLKRRKASLGKSDVRTNPRRFLFALKPDQPRVPFRLSFLWPLDTTRAGSTERHHMGLRSTGEHTEHVLHDTLVVIRPKDSPSFTLLAYKKTLSSKGCAVPPCDAIMPIRGKYIIALAVFLPKRSDHPRHYSHIIRPVARDSPLRFGFVHQH